LEAAMRITTTGQVTIPLEVRERLGLLPHTEVEFTIRGNTAVLTKATGGTRRGRTLVQHMRGRGSVRMSTDEILGLTRDAPAVRSK
ncbi:MAG: AbrB/MazE/SpoVT family DNA-binding domain-containing protein, partial [bacterium]